MNKLFLVATILMGISVTRCSKKPAVNTTTPYYPGIIQTGNPKKILALGDSYTIGQSVTAEERFPAQTVAYLKAAGVNALAPDYIATTGWTTDDLSAAITSGQPAADYDLVTLLIGVNDQYQRRDTTGYRAKFRSLLNTAITLARNTPEHVVVLSIPDYSVTPFAANSDTANIRMQINQFNAINLSVASESQIAYLDITGSTREALNDPELIAGDGLHPSGKEYNKWAQRLAELTKVFLR